MKNRCFLCGKPNGHKNVAITTRVPTSQKPLQTILQHLGNCLKTKLVFQTTNAVSVCRACYEDLVEYDNVMVKLLSYQRKLKQQLHSRLNTEDTSSEMEEDGEVHQHTNTTETVSENFAAEIVEQEEVFGPDLDVKEEFITDDRIIDVDTGDVAAEEVAIQGIVFDKGDGFTDDGDGERNNYEDDDGDTSSELSLSTGKRRLYSECVVCGSEFRTRAQLQQHIAEIHKHKTYSCNICGAVRRDEEYLDLHMNLHEGKTENECRFCGKRFSRPMNTLRHMRKHWDKKKFQCEKCGERFSLDNMLYNHRMRHEAEENPLICSICNQSFKSRKTFNHHMTIHQENRPRHHCTHCTKSFTERYTLKMHMKTHRGVVMPAAAVPIVVQQEPQSQKPQVVAEHETEAAVIALVTDADSTKGFKCVICNCKFEFKDMFEQHLRAEHDVVM